MIQGLVKDTIKKANDLPRNYRNLMTLDYESVLCNANGMENLRCIASGQYTKKEFKFAIEKYNPKQVYVLDLRCESHFFLDDKPFSWCDKENMANSGKSISEILMDESSKIEVFQSNKSQVYYRHSSLDKDLQKLPDTKIKYFSFAESEKEFIHNLGCKYYRLPVLDHQRPSDQVVQEFLDITSRLPKDAILYMHCKGGMGRATTFMVLFDIVKNPKIPLEDILMRQTALSSKDLQDMTQYIGRKACRLTKAQERLAFIKQFYNYVTSDGILSQSWIDYVHTLFAESQKIPKVNFLPAFNLQKESFNEGDTHIIESSPPKIDKRETSPLKDKVYRQTLIH